MKHWLKLVCMTTALASVSSLALAQESGIEEVVVTAQKRAQNVQDVPISMSVVSGAAIAKFHALDLHDVMNSVPNLYIERLNAADAIYIRGFGSAPANFAFDPAVSMYVDGVYNGRGKQFAAPFFDIERMEVLRGPQGALFGKNTPAGAISVVTKNPTDQFEAAATVDYNFDLDGTDVSGYVSGPITDTLKARLAVKATDYNGYIVNVNNNTKDPRKKNRVARLTLEYQPQAGIDIVGKFEYSDADEHGNNFVLAPTNAPGPVTSVRFNDENPFGYPEEDRVTAHNASVTSNFALGDFTLTGVTGFSQYNASRANVYSKDIPALYSNRMPEKFEQFSQEVRLLSPTGHALEYVVGAYFDHSNYDLIYNITYNLLGGALAGMQHSHYTQNADTYSVFGQATYHILDGLRLIGSLRWTQTDKTGHYRTFNDYGTPLHGLSTADGTMSENNIDPSATVQYDLTKEVMFYAVYGRGSKSGGFLSNTWGTTNANFAFKPEKSTNYEAGVKSTLFDGRVVLNASLYDTKFEDLQVSIYDSSSNSFQTRNAASATSKGVEMQAIWQPIDSLELSLNGAYTDAKYDSFPGSTCLAWQPLSACNPAVPASVAANNIAGARLPYTSRWSGTFEAAYHRPIGQDLDLSTDLQAHYRSSYYNADNQSPIYGIQPSFVKIDARVELASADDRWSVALIGKNLTDEKTYNFSFLLPYPLTNYPAVHKFLDEPRTVAIEGTLRF